MNLEKEVEIFLRSRFTLICVISYEEERIIDQLKSLCERTQRVFYVWDHADYFQPVTGVRSPPPEAKEPMLALEAIEHINADGIFLLRDFHQCWRNQPRIVRKLRNLAHKLKYTKKSIIITMPAKSVPDELRDCAVVVEFPSPGPRELGAVLDKLATSPGVTVELSDEQREQVLSSALGLSSNQAQRVFSKVIVSNGRLDESDIPMITNEKKDIIRESGALQFYPVFESVAQVGGLDVIKGWLKMRQRAFTQAARDYGLALPKGVALIGIPGTGKSLTAKMISGMWKLPLIRMDIGALFGSLVGQSEENTRRALLLAETISPCLLWIDEMEKGLSVGSGDGGTSMRVFSTILSWMQEKTKPVFIVATANDISKLPPELLRRGRFDEIFFLDLPISTERKAIFSVHIQKRGRDPERFDLDALAKASEGYVGAEIEQSVIDAMYRAFSDEGQPGREFTTADVVHCLKQLVPMSTSQRENIGALRAWLHEGRAQSASFEETQEAEKKFVKLPEGGAAV